MYKSLLVLAVALPFTGVESVVCQPQTRTMTFSPAGLPGGGRVETSRLEDGFALLGNDQFISTSAGLALESSFPVNGTDYVQFAFGQAGAAIVPVDGSVFDLLSIDLAEYSGVTLANGTQPEFIDVAGFKADGTFVSASFQLDMSIDGDGGTPDFETFVPGAAFRGLVAIEFTNTLFSLDNVVFQVPAPATVVSVASLAMAGAARRRRV